MLKKNEYFFFIFDENVKDFALNEAFSVNTAKQTMATQYHIPTSRAHISCKTSKREREKKEIEFAERLQLLNVW